MLIRRLAASAVIVVAAFTLSIAHASATTLAPVLHCGVNPTTDVRLARNLTCADSFTIGTGSSTKPITIDLAGHTLRVTNPDVPCRFGQPGVSCAIFAVGPVHLIDGTIQGSVGVASVRGPSRISGVALHGDLWMSGIGGHVILSSLSQGSIRAFSSSFNVEDTVVRGGGITFDDGDTQMAIDIEHNLVVSSPDAGVAGVLGGGGEFRNDVTGEIRGNTVISPTGAGISLTGALTNLGTFTLARNGVTNAGGDGIHIVGTATPPTPYLGGPVTLTRNQVSGSVGYAINAPWVTNLTGTAVVDGGGNVGYHNGLTPCVGVAC